MVVFAAVVVLHIKGGELDGYSQPLLHLYNIGIVQVTGVVAWEARGGQDMTGLGTWGRKLPVVATGGAVGGTGERGLPTADPLLVITTLQVRGGEAGEAGGRGHGGAAWGMGLLLYQWANK